MRKNTSLLLLLAFLYSACGNDQSPPQEQAPALSYAEVKKQISDKRKKIASQWNNVHHRGPLYDSITNLWVKAIGNDLYYHWKNTPWDFNGTTQTPGEGSIACGFFVTTILQDMDLPIERRKLAICASSEMMKSISNHKPVNMSRPTYEKFIHQLDSMGKGVYIIGLDFHTGFIVNDGSDTWFIHSNYINRKGVTKEKVADSEALKASKTRWVAVISGNNYVIRNWLRIPN
jgi:hypothetical protein